MIFSIVFGLCSNNSVLISVKKSLRLLIFLILFPINYFFIRRNHNVARKERKRRACTQATEASEITDDFLQKRTKSYATRTSRERLQKRAVMSAVRQDLRFFRVARFKTKRKGNAFLRSLFVLGKVTCFRWRVYFSLQPFVVDVLLFRLG